MVWKMTNYRWDEIDEEVIEKRVDVRGNYEEDRDSSEKSVE